ncbi:MAG: hypothetical protein M3474_05665 [Actinomycetota bacterium]|nr:hypothetical protein [Actinomycetota bacterium]
MTLRRRTGVHRKPLMALLCLLVLSGSGGAQAWGQETRSDIVIKDKRVSESSALGVSPADDGLLYTVNDSGHDPIVFVIERASGDIVGTTLLKGLDPEVVDPEALAVQGKTLWVADTGDNRHERDDVALYSLPAPGRGEHTVQPETYPLTYPAGNPDVEALLMAPDGGGWLITKEVLGGEVLALPDDMQPDEPVKPEPVPDVRVPGLVTDASVLPGGEGAVVRLYGKALMYRLSDWSKVATIDLPSQQQGESITVLGDGATLLAGSEGSPALIDSVQVPSTVLADLDRPAETTDSADAASSQPDADPTTASSDEPADAVDAQVLVIAAVLAGLVVLGGGLVWLRRRMLARREAPYY